MANILGIELEGKTVILKQSYFRSSLVNTDHPFVCKSGFGCSSRSRGTAIFGYFISDKEQTKIDSFEIERLKED